MLLGASTQANGSIALSQMSPVATSSSSSNAVTQAPQQIIQVGALMEFSCLNLTQPDLLMCSLDKRYLLCDNFTGRKEQVSWVVLWVAGSRGTAVGMMHGWILAFYLAPFPLGLYSMMQRFQVFMLSYVMLFYVILCYAVLCYLMVFRIIFCYVISFIHSFKDVCNTCSMKLLSGVPDSSLITRAWPIHRQHSPSGPIVGQSEPSANDDNRWPVRADVSRWCYSLNSPSL